MLRKRWSATLALVGLLVTAIAAAPSAVYASEKGRKNTAMALGAAAIYSLLTDKPTMGLILGAGGLYAYKKYKDEKEESRAKQARRQGYRAGLRTARIGR
jgi:hypothetical protein